MKDIVFLSILVLISLSIDSISAFGIPECHHERDLDILWPCDEDKTKYFQCIDIHEHALMPCGAGTWFDFGAQSCKRPSEWKPPFPEPQPGPKPTPEVDPEPKPEPEIDSEEEIDPEYEDNPETEIKPSKKPRPPIVTKKTTKHLTPPTIGRSKRTTRKAYPTPSTPVPTAPTALQGKDNKRPPVPIRKSSVRTTKKKRVVPVGERKIPTKTVAKTKDNSEEEEEDKEKIVVKRKKQKIVPTKSS